MLHSAIGYKKREHRYFYFLIEKLNSEVFLLIDISDLFLIIKWIRVVSLNASGLLRTETDWYKLQK